MAGNFKQTTQKNGYTGISAEGSIVKEIFFIFNLSLKLDEGLMSWTCDHKKKKKSQTSDRGLK